MVPNTVAPSPEFDVQNRHLYFISFIYASLYIVNNGEIEMENHNFSIDEQIDYAWDYDDIYMSDSFSSEGFLLSPSHSDSNVFFSDESVYSNISFSS